MKLSQLIFFFYLTLHSYYSNIKQTKNKIILSVFKRYKLRHFKNKMTSFEIKIT